MVKPTRTCPYSTQLALTKTKNMGLFEKLKNTIETNEIKRKKSHLKNLYTVAMADGTLRNEEFDFMLNVANKLYLDPNIVQNIVNYPDDIIISQPKNNREKLDQIYDCVCMAVCDGELNDREISVCKLIAVKLGFRPIVVDRLIESIIQGIVKGIASEIALNKLLNEI